MNLCISSSCLFNKKYASNPTTGQNIEAPFRSPTANAISYNHNIVRGYNKGTTNSNFWHTFPCIRLKYVSHNNNLISQRVKIMTTNRPQHISWQFECCTCLMCACIALRFRLIREVTKFLLSKLLVYWSMGTNNNMHNYLSDSW